MVALAASLPWLIRAVVPRYLDYRIAKALADHHRRKHKRGRGRRVNGRDTSLEKWEREEGDEERE